MIELEPRLNRRKFLKSISKLSNNATFAASIGALLSFKLPR